MKFLIQVVKKASVDVDDKTIGKIDRGFLIFVGVCDSDTKEIADKMIKKTVNLRIFEDENGKTNLSIGDIGGIRIHSVGIIRYIQNRYSMRIIRCRYAGKPYQ